jgi:hypothetical protein
MSSVSKPLSVFEDNPFVEGLFDWMASPEGILFEQIRELAWQMLEPVTVDTNKRELLWEDGQALNIEQSAQRINETVEPGQGVTGELIESEIIGWLEMAHVPDGYTDAQLEEHELKVATWVKDYKCQQNRKITP